MRISIRGKAVSQSQNRAQAEQSLRLALSRFAPRITRLTLTVKPGAREGQLAVALGVKLDEGSLITVEDVDSAVLPLVDRTADRAARAVSRALQRSRDGQFGKN